MVLVNAGKWDELLAVVSSSAVVAASFLPHSGCFLVPFLVTSEVGNKQGAVCFSTPPVQFFSDWKLFTSGAETLTCVLSGYLPDFLNWLRSSVALLFEFMTAPTCKRLLDRLFLLKLASTEL